MHTIKPYETRVTVFDQEGGKYVYATKAEAFKELGQRFISAIGEHFKSFSHRAYWHADANSYNTEVHYSTSKYIMRDDNGEPLTLADFSQYKLKYKYKSHYLMRERRALNYAGYGHTVPGTGRSHSHRGTYYRRPATTAERRLNQIVDWDEPQTRPSRNLANLTNAWDDYIRSDRDDKNWKRNRKTQYKTQKAPKGAYIMKL